MTMKRYLVVAGLLLAAVALWLFPETREFGYLAVAFAFLAALAYPFLRLFRAIIHRLER